MKRIAIDMDEVMADTFKKHLQLYNRDYEESLTREHLMGYRLGEYHPHRRREISSYFDDPSFLRDLDVIAGSQEVIRELSDSFEVFIATAAMEIPRSFTAKYEWLLENFPFLKEVNFVFCGDKSIIHADYLIDDSPHNFERFIGQGLLFTAPHNVNVTGYPRVDTWWDVREYFVGKEGLSRRSRHNRER